MTYKHNSLFVFEIETIPDIVPVIARIGTAICWMCCPIRALPPELSLMNYVRSWVSQVSLVWMGANLGTLRTEDYNRAVEETIACLKAGHEEKPHFLEFLKAWGSACREVFYF